MNEVKINKRILTALILLVCSFAILAYQLRYSERARVKENLKDFGRAESFVSQVQSQIDIKSYMKSGGYSFTILEGKNVENFQELGKVSMFDGNGDLINFFILLECDGKHIIYMREVYMAID